MLAHLDLAVLVALNVVAFSLSEILPPKNPPSPTDVKLLESKDVLLQMLENKLKEIKDTKKRRDSRNGNGEVLPKKVDINMKSNGIGGIGEIDLLIRHGKNGQGAVNMTAEGISNVGRIQLAVGLGDSGIHIPGLSNIFDGLKSRISNKDQNQLQPMKFNNDFNSGFRQQNDFNNAKQDNIATADIETKKDNAEVKDGNILVDNHVAKTSSASKEIDMITARDIEAKKINGVVKVDNIGNNRAKSNTVPTANDIDNVALAANPGISIRSSVMSYDTSASHGFVTQGLRT